MQEIEQFARMNLYFASFKRRYFFDGNACPAIFGRWLADKEDDNGTGE